MGYSQAGCLASAFSPLFSQSYGKALCFDTVMHRRTPSGLTGIGQTGLLKGRPAP